MTVAEQFKFFAVKYALCDLEKQKYLKELLKLYEQSVALKNAGDLINSKYFNEKVEEKVDIYKKKADRKSIDNNLILNNVSFKREYEKLNDKEKEVFDKYITSVLTIPYKDYVSEKNPLDIKHLPEIDTLRLATIDFSDINTNFNKLVKVTTIAFLLQAVQRPLSEDKRYAEDGIVKEPSVVMLWNREVLIYLTKIINALYNEQSGRAVNKNKTELFNTFKGDIDDEGFKELIRKSINKPGFYTTDPSDEQVGYEALVTTAYYQASQQMTYKQLTDFYTEINKSYLYWSRQFNAEDACGAKDNIMMRGRRNRMANNIAYLGALQIVVKEEIETFGNRFPEQTIYTDLDSIRQQDVEKIQQGEEILTKSIETASGYVNDEGFNKLVEEKANRYKKEALPKQQPQPSTEEQIEFKSVKRVLLDDACDLVYNDAVETINYDALYAIAKNQLKTRSESFYQRFSKTIEDLDNTIKADHKMSIKTFEELTDKPSMEKLYSNKIAKLEDFETYLDQLSKILNIEYTNKV